MATFDYVALDLSGRTRRGQLKAVDEAAAADQLQRKRLAPVKIMASVAKPAQVGRFALGQGLSAKDRSMFTRQLATLTSVSTLEEALRTIALQADKPKLKQVIGEVHAAVLEGYRLSDAMGRPAKAFPPLYRAMVAAGESSGALPAILDRLADLLEQQQQVRAKITTALVYPIVLAVVACLVVAALMVFVIPKVVEQFDSMGQTLPLLTRLVIGLSTGLQTFGWLIVVSAVVAVFAFLRALRHRPFKLAVDRWLLRLPMIGRLIRDVHAARLARTLATMVASGLPVLEGLILTAGTVRNAVLQAALDDMIAAIREGGALSVAMRRAEVFPPVLVYMTASGESSGRVEAMLMRAADYLEREFETFTATLLSLLEPAIIVLLGGVVATIVLSILLPILQINNLALT
ncbi:type II secretion system protein GspF [Caulobacter vibrioides]|uniref:type II secretion system inner membrane protein GspF n=1 Tax=Caulobacter vibrioides TaxID=155892 RepID=UPI000BB4929E|nr:type II secretion system inner membrane protein GspF [Caulobacter vibrioides]ATC23192.1 type II secretion system protein GspF [Caulobacter vibrioides]AZH11400.1 type II secretion system protein GspF [Caulobacter vibrioides]PLR13135.1 type II secretion system protein GspF [Caulobacter vibrioides]